MPRFQFVDMPVEPRFWARVEKTETCWNWTAGRTAPGWYGKLSIHGKNVCAHRVSWELHYGPIPKGMHVLHSCDNPACVRPDHLMLGTQMANMQDAAKKGRLGRVAPRTACPQGHPYSPENTWRENGRRHCRTCITDWLRRSRATPEGRERHRFKEQQRREARRPADAREAATRIDRALRRTS